MSAAMQQSASQQNFFGCSYYMSPTFTLAGDLSLSDYDDGERHERELQLQDRMHNSISFHADMMSDIMYFHQATSSGEGSQGTCSQEAPRPD